MSLLSKGQHRKSPTRMLAAAATLVSLLALTGSSLVTTAVPASAAAGGTNVCASLNATFDPSTGLSIGTLTGCHQQGSGTTVEAPNLADPFAPNPVTLYWSTGHATSHLIVSSGPASGNPCPAGDIAGQVSISVVSGPYAGSTGGYVICLDLSDFPVIHSTSVGPVVI
jgi:hypothetical protein